MKKAMYRTCALMAACTMSGSMLPMTSAVFAMETQAKNVIATGAKASICYPKNDEDLSQDVIHAQGALGEFLIRKSDHTATLVKAYADPSEYAANNFQIQYANSQDADAQEDWYRITQIGDGNSPIYENGSEQSQDFSLIPANQDNSIPTVTSYTLTIANGAFQGFAGNMIIPPASFAQAGRTISASMHYDDNAFSDSIGAFIVESASDLPGTYQTLYPGKIITPPEIIDAPSSGCAYDIMTVVLKKGTFYSGTRFECTNQVMMDNSPFYPFTFSEIDSNGNGIFKSTGVPVGPELFRFYFSRTGSPPKGAVFSSMYY